MLPGMEQKETGSAAAGSACEKPVATMEYSRRLTTKGAHFATAMSCYFAVVAPESCAAGRRPVGCLTPSRSASHSASVTACPYQSLLK